MGLKVSVYVFKTCGTNIKCLGGCLGQTSEGRLESIEASFDMHLRLNTGEVMVPDSCSDRHGVRSGVFERKLLCLH